MNHQTFTAQLVWRTQSDTHHGVCYCVREPFFFFQSVSACCRMFLIRESQQHSQCFVLSLCHKLKTKHYLVIPVSSRPLLCMSDPGPIRNLLSLWMARTPTLSVCSVKTAAGSTTPWTMAWRCSSTSCSWWSSIRSTRASSLCASNTPVCALRCESHLSVAVTPITQLDYTSNGGTRRWTLCGDSRKVRRTPPPPPPSRFFFFFLIIFTSVSTWNLFFYFNWTNCCPHGDSSISHAGQTFSAPITCTLIQNGWMSLKERAAMMDSRGCCEADPFQEKRTPVFW